VAAHRPFHLQPARQMLFDQRWPVGRAAEAIDVSPTHLTNCLYGRCPPSPEVRDRLPILLSARLTDLFTEAALAAPYHGPRGAYWLKRASAGASADTGADSDAK